MSVFSQTTLRALHAMLSQHKNPHNIATLVPAFGLRETISERPCRFGVGARETVYTKTPLINDYFSISAAIELTPKWFLCLTSGYTKDDGSESAPATPSIEKPRTWAPKTFERIYTLLRDAECYTFDIMETANHTPAGNAQESGRDAPKIEWVDQGGGGFSGDDFHGTITWKLGDYYLIGHY